MEFFVYLSSSKITAFSFYLKKSYRIFKTFISSIVNPKSIEEYDAVLKNHGL